MASKIAKTIVFTVQSHEHHTQVKVKNVLKWLKSGHEVRISITGKADRQKAMETLYKQLEKDVKSGAKFLQKVVKPEQIKVVLQPTPEASNLVIDDLKPKTEVPVEEELNITADSDIFSEDFEKTLNKSIREERSKNKKR